MFQNSREPVLISSNVAHGVIHKFESHPLLHPPIHRQAYSRLHQSVSQTSTPPQSSGGKQSSNGRGRARSFQFQATTARNVDALQLTHNMEFARYHVVSPFCAQKPTRPARGTARVQPLLSKGEPARVQPQQHSQSESLATEQLLRFERQGHISVPQLFDRDEMTALAGSVTEAAKRERLNAYRHRVAVLCPGVDPFSLHSIADAEAVIRQQVVSQPAIVNPLSRVPRGL